MNFLHWVFYLLPWYAQVLLLLVPVGIGFFLAVQVFGWNRVKGWILPALAVLVAIGGYTRAKQAGYADRKADEDTAKKKADAVVTDEKDKARKASDDTLDKEIDKWSRP